MHVSWYDYIFLLATWYVCTWKNNLSHHDLFFLHFQVATCTFATCQYVFRKSRLKLCIEFNDNVFLFMLNPTSKTYCVYTFIRLHNAIYKSQSAFTPITKVG